MSKISIRFYNDREVRAVWDEDNSKWWFSVLDIVGVLNGQDDYQKNRNYWKYLKTKLKKENNELVSVTNQLKLSAPDGKRRLTDVLDNDGVIQLAKNFSKVRAYFLAPNSNKRINTTKVAVTRFSSIISENAVHTQQRLHHLSLFSQRKSKGRHR